MNRSPPGSPNATLINPDIYEGVSSETPSSPLTPKTSGHQLSELPASFMAESKKHDRSAKLNSRGASTDEDNELLIDVDGIDLSGLPSALIVANLPDDLFRDSTVKEEFQAMFRAVDPGVQFGYFKCFRRARLAFSSPVVATRVRLLSQGSIFHGKAIKCYYHEPIATGTHQLGLPEPTKLFLISPPASPPVGWEQIKEHSPIQGAITPSILNNHGGPITEDVAESVQQKPILKQSPAANITGIELMAALAKLVPGERTEILSPDQGKPGIVIQTCEDNAAFKPGKIQQTRRPEAAKYK